MPKFLFYKMTYDTGFAPNPYGEYLTLATCTPNHIRGKMSFGIGDWIVGVESKTLAQKRKKAGCHPKVDQCLIYVAKVDEILDLDKYFNDPRFEYKKTKPKSRIYSERRGDNVYYIDSGMWKWIRGHDHDSGSAPFFRVGSLGRLLKSGKARRIYGPILQDIIGNRVFISRHFLYFGDAGVEFDKRFLSCVPRNRSIKYCPGKNCPKECFTQFKLYLDSLLTKFGYGKHGDPICYCIRHKLGKRGFCK